MTVRIITGDCRQVLRELPDESVHCVVTSPPYWGLRDYGTASWEGGDPGCGHTGVARRCDIPGRNDKQSTQRGSSSDRVSRNCLHCGARRIDRQIGLEGTISEHVDGIVEVFGEVRRVLRRDGTLWLNYGDCYVTAPPGNKAGSGFSQTRPRRMQICDGLYDRKQERQQNRDVIWGGKFKQGLKPKDLCGIPWRVAFALQADGWYLRQDIIWSKPNPMPESVRDRCTKAHEYIFLLSKSERYYFDQGAIMEPVTAFTIERLSQLTLEQQEGSWRVPGKTNGPMKAALPRRAKEHLEAARPPNARSHAGLSQFEAENAREYLTRNRRSVWEVTTQPFSEAHFATFPPALIEPCILAGCPKGGTVLDPFGGAGTTGLVADRLGRHAILIELNPKYVEMAERRIRGDAPLFADVATSMVEGEDDATGLDRAAAQA